MDNRCCASCLKFCQTRCSRCHIAYYCCNECQIVDWSKHVKECNRKYDEFAICANLVKFFLNDREARNCFVSLVRSNPGAHGVVIRCNNAYEARMAMRSHKGRLMMKILTHHEQYENTPPISVTGMRPGKDYVLVIEVKQSNGPLYNSNALAVAFDFDEPDQHHYF